MDQIRVIMDQIQGKSGSIFDPFLPQIVQTVRVKMDQLITILDMKRIRFAYDRQVQ